MNEILEKLSELKGSTLCLILSDWEVPNRWNADIKIKHPRGGFSSGKSGAMATAEEAVKEAWSQVEHVLDIKRAD